MSKTLYDIVGVARDASPDAIASAAQTRMEAIKLAHAKGDANAATDSYALKEAFSILRDANKRAAYDAKLDMKAELTLAPGPAADPVLKREPVDSGTATATEEPKPADLIIYRDGEEPHDDGDPVKQFIALATTAVLIAVAVGYRAYRAELRNLDRVTAENIASFNTTSWIRTLGPAKPVVEVEEEPEKPKPFSLESFEREQEKRDEENRRRMERERRDYDRARQREQYEDQQRASRGF